MRRLHRPAVSRFVTLLENDLIVEITEIASPAKKTPGRTVKQLRNSSNVTAFQMGMIVECSSFNLLYKEM